MTDLFEENTQDGNNQNDPATPQVTSGPEDLLAGIVNEDGVQKFKSVEDVIKGYQASQDFINTLKNEKSTVEQQMQELAGKVKSQEELAELLNTPKDPEPITAPAVELPSDLVKADDVVAILEQREAQKIADANVRSVKAAMKEAFGADASGKLQELTANAGLDKATAQTLATKSPEALLKLLGVEKAVVPAVPSGGEVNSLTLNDKTPTQAKSVMGMGSSKDLVNEFKASAQRTLDRLNS